MPGCSGYACRLVFVCVFCTRDRGCRPTPGTPCAILIEPKVKAQPGETLRGNADAHLVGCLKINRRVFHAIARSECDEAIHASASGAMDCFASLAMTVTGSRVQAHESPYAVRATGLRRRVRFTCAASGPGRSANSSGLISAAGFGGLNK
jgi:hypothetical protein